MTILTRRGQLFLLSGLLSASVATHSIRACTCGENRSGKSMREIVRAYSEGANANRIIFEGIVEKQELVRAPLPNLSDSLSAKLFPTHRAVWTKVLRMYRGDSAETMKILTGMSYGDCGFDFETGSIYLIYAERIDADSLFTTICMGTSGLDQSGPALRLLRREEPSPDDLLDPQSYFNKLAGSWTGTLSGRVTRADGKPLAQASVEMTRIPEESFLPKSASHSDISGPDGSFLIRFVRPGRYLLTAYKLEIGDHLRWTGYFSGVRRESEATTIEVHSGEKVSDIQFSVSKARVHTILFRIVTSDGSFVPLDKLGVSVDSVDPELLAYHLTQSRNLNGIFPAGFVPPGRYVVQSYVRPDPKTGSVPGTLAKWQMARKELDLSTDAEVILTLTPAQ